MPAGTLSIVADYEGNSQTLTSTSAPFAQTVNQATTSTGLVSGTNPSISGHVVKLTATVTSPTTAPTGTVSFYNGATLLDTLAVPASGIVVYNTSGLPEGTDNLTAVYNGSANIIGSTSNVVVQTVNP